MVTKEGMSKIIGVNKRYYPSEINPYNPPATVCVLVQGDIGDYAAYVGHGSDDFVMRWGNKISFEEAKVQFPGIVKEKYRD